MPRKRRRKNANQGTVKAKKNRQSKSSPKRAHAEKKVQKRRAKQGRAKSSRRNRGIATRLPAARQPLQRTVIHRRSGFSRYRYDNQWFETSFDEAVLTDTRFAVDLLDAGDVLHVTADLGNDGIYHGRYSYLSHPDRGVPGAMFGPGEVHLERTDDNGAVSLKGHWKEVNNRDVWFFEIDPPE
jgi:hypothetical protein